MTRTPDLFDTIDRLQKKLEEISNEARAEQQQLDQVLLLADVASVLRKVDTRHMSESNRVQLAGVKKRVFAALGASL